MKPFLDDHFLLETNTAVELYEKHASGMPVIDYHSHLPPGDMAEDKKFRNLTHIWLEGDHYKWRAMRANGIDEHFITGPAGDFDKFMKWAETVPYTLRNPLYHWTHMELKKVFGIGQLLEPGSAREIYENCSARLQAPDFSTRNLLKRFNVEVVCTTDDPADPLNHHRKLKKDFISTRVLPTFRPDKALQCDQPVKYNAYLDVLGASAGIEISGFNSLLDALKARHDFFHETGCRISDHGLEFIYAFEHTEKQAAIIFDKIRSGKEVDMADKNILKSSLLVIFAEMDHEKGWAQQYHLGALRNNNSRMMTMLGPDSGFDSIGDFEMGRPLSIFLDSLDFKNKLAKTILYNLNPRDNYLFASMAGNFNDGKIPGKIQFGAGWWFLDQKEGMEWQLNALSNLGLLSRFVGMLTDSRSFLSYVRHDYFRRILCNLLGRDVEKGWLPRDMGWLGKTIENICYYNAKNYFNF